jgi:hypothetical protein
MHIEKAISQIDPYTLAICQLLESSKIPLIVHEESQCYDFREKSTQHN